MNFKLVFVSLLSAFSLAAESQAGDFAPEKLAVRAVISPSQMAQGLLDHHCQTADMPDGLFIRRLIEYSSPSALTFTDMPDCVVEYGVSSHLLPGSLARLGQTCKKIHKAANKALLCNYTKVSRTDPSRRVYDIEKLYDLYHVVEDEFEKTTIKKLIQGSFPEATGNCFIQHNYNSYKNELFTGDFMQSYPKISREYPEVSRMLLKHKQFVHKTPSLFIDEPLNPELVDTFLEIIEAIKPTNLESLFRTSDPRLLAGFFKVLEPKPESVKEILETGKFDILDGGDIHQMTMFLIISLANKDNMELVLKALEKFKNKRALLRFASNFKQYPHLKPFIVKLFTSLRLGEIQKRDYIIDLCLVPEGQEYYEAIRDDAKEALEFLKCFENGVFGLGKPEYISTRDIFEAALVYNMPEEVMRTIMADVQFAHDAHLLILAINKGLPSPFLLDLMHTKVVEEGQIETMSKIKVPVEIEVFELLVTHRFKAYSVCELFLMFDKSVPHLEYLKYFLQHQDRPGYADEVNSLMYVILGGSGNDYSAMSRELIKWKFERGQEIKWGFIVAPPEVIKFFENQKTAALLKYIPKEVHKITKSSFGLAATIVLSRTNPNTLFQHYGYKNLELADQYNGAMLLSQHPNFQMKSLKGLLERKLQNAVPFLKEIFGQQDSPEYAHKIFKYLCSLKDRQVSRLLGNYIMTEITAKVPICHVIPLMYIRPYHLETIMLNDANFLPVLNLNYYGPRLAKILVDAGLLDEIILQLVRRLGVASYADFVQNWSTLLPYLPEDPEAVDQMILLANQ